MSLCINPGCSNPQNPNNNRFCQCCGSDLILVGEYRVVRLLSGKGGFGNTYETTDGGAAKVLKVLTNPSGKAIELFQQEAQLLQQLNHPGIPKGEKYFIYHTREGQTPLHCLVMEKIEGEDLEEYRGKHSQPMTQALALNWLAQLASILHAVHEHNFYHRDIKPSNIILRPDGQLVLIDFGAARQVTGTVLVGGQNTSIYTPGYAPPEQSTGHSSPQSDFYALGRTFVFLLTGKEPSDSDIYDFQNNLFNWRPYAPQIAEPFANFLDQLMADRVMDRPKNTDVIMKRIEAIRKDPYNLNYVLNLSQGNDENSYKTFIEELNKISKNLTSSPNYQSDPKITDVIETLENLKRKTSPPRKGGKKQPLNLVTSPTQSLPQQSPPPVHQPLQNQQSSSDTVHYAGFWVRFKAALFDSLILLIAGASLGGYLGYKLQFSDILARLALDLGVGKEYFIYYGTALGALGTTTIGFFLAIAGAVIYWHPLPDFNYFTRDQLAGLVAGLLVGILIKWAYSTLLETLCKGTLGKLLFDLKVSDIKGRRISLATANRRYFLKLFSAVPLYLGFMIAGWNKKKRALHDFIAGTQIIRKK
ncbi:MAG: Serine/threonine-protein kinase PknD [Chroococcopsis gigantea SAG 12.99]|jgi:serine/threonine protein kinase|nr:RDD family protein [Chlorogloea purpurea SAG 13.99]MDV2999728.1 Serine/threonine-protein kinase PknD [Chroococcopsis gigantea SAG 12.99]